LHQLEHRVATGLKEALPKSKEELFKAYREITTYSSKETNLVEYFASLPKENQQKIFADCSGDESLQDYIRGC
jgi:hypothetical protein